MNFHLLHKNTKVIDREKSRGKWKLGGSQHTNLFWGGVWAAKVKTYSDNPLCSQGNSKGNPASPPLCPTPDPFTSLVVAGVACKEKGKEGWLTLLDLITVSQTW